MDDIYYYMMLTGSSMKEAVTPEERNENNQFLWVKADLAE